MPQERRPVTEQELRNRLAAFDVRIDEDLLADAAFRDTIPGPPLHNRWSGYVYFSPASGGTVYLHRLIIQYIQGVTLRNDQYVDHQDRDRRNNLITNLRVCTAGENASNRSRSTNNTSGMTGVSWYARVKKWEAYINAKHKRQHLGYFEEYEGAVAARVQAEGKYHGPFAASAGPPSPKNRGADAQAALRAKIQKTEEYLRETFAAQKKRATVTPTYDPHWIDAIRRERELWEQRQRETPEQRFERLRDALLGPSGPERDRADAEISRLMDECEEQDRARAGRSSPLPVCRDVGSERGGPTTD